MAFIIRLSIILLSLSCFALSAQTKARTGATLVLEDEDMLIYNNDGRKGFEIISTVDGMPEVLGYSDNGYFDPDNIPPAMKIWMGMMKETSHAVRNGARLNLPMAPMTRAAQKEIKPLLGGLAWGQESPYNYKCPLDQGALSVTGCSATATAMLVKYHKYASGKGNIEYLTGEKKIRVKYNFEEKLPTLDWDNMLDAYTCDAELVPDEKVEDEFGSDLVYTNMTVTGSIRGIAVQIDTMINVAKALTFGDVQFLLFDDNNNFISPIGQKLEINFASRGGFLHVTTYITLPESLADGKYYAYIGYKKGLGKSWTKPNRVKYNKITSGTVKQPIFLTLEKKGLLVKCGDFTCRVAHTKEQADAVAELMFACGASMKMDYTSFESAASMNETITGLIDYFGYDRDICTAACEYLNDDTAQKIVIEELNAGRPMFIAGATKDASGHAFLADGVRYSAMGTPSFHINWGWDGMANGYFLLNKLDPTDSGTGGAGSGSNYSNELYLICGIKPEDGVKEAFPIVYESLKCDKSEVTVGESVELTLSNILNLAAVHLDSEVPVAFIVDEKGKETPLGEFKEVKNVKPWNYAKNPSTATVTIPTTIPSGTYKIVARYKGKTGNYGKLLTDKYAKLTVTNPTAISGISQDSSDAETYDLEGRKTQSVNGVAIRNGKVIIRK